MSNFNVGIVIVSVCWCFLCSSWAGYTLKSVDTRGDWTGGPTSGWEQCSGKIASKWKEKSFPMDEFGRLLDEKGKSNIEYVTSMRLRKNVYNTVWHASDHFLLSSTCERDKKTRVKKCTVIVVDEDNHCYWTAELLPAKK